jgi:ABC-type polysaccharide/polyol phosphate transport system ATPase subunit
MNNNEISILINNASVKYRRYESASRSVKTQLLKPVNSSGKDYEALKELSLEILKGEILGVIGRNGAGKSTFAKLILGIVSPSVGYVITKGTSAGILQLGLGLDPDLSGEENIQILQMLRGGWKKDALDLCGEIAEWTGLGLKLKDPIRTYSSGMLARFSFAIETSIESDILLIDEVLSVGDFEFQERSNEKMKALMSGGKTIILISHDMNVISQTCSKALYLKKGSMCAYGPTEETISKYLNDKS